MQVTKKMQMHCCLLCSYTTKYPSYLQRHVLVHSKTNTIPCDFCGKYFRTVSERNMHQKIHSLEEHVCMMCGFSSGLKKVLDRHMLVHDEEKRFKCTQCSYCCKRLMDIKKHLVCMHSGRPRRKRSEEDCCATLSDMCVPFQREVAVKFHVPTAPRKFARIDLFWRAPFGAVAFEVDEYAHKGYSVEYECQRMSLIFEELAKTFGRLHIIRYNPHPLRGEQRPTKEEREEQIKLALSYEPQLPLTISYLLPHERWFSRNRSIAAVQPQRSHSSTRHVEPTWCDINVKYKLRGSCSKHCPFLIRAS